MMRKALVLAVALTLGLVGCTLRPQPFATTGLGVDPTGGEWTVVNSSHPAAREDANTITFDVPVQKRGKTKLTYKVRVRWC